MFTGLIQKTTNILSAKKASGNLILRLKTPAGWKLKPGESIATDGACLTVSKTGKGFYECALIPQTLFTTKFGHGIPKIVNLERPLRLNDLVGGHLVSGHIDSVGKILSLKKSQGKCNIAVQFPKKFGKWVIDKGSIAIDGISLTISSCTNTTLTVAVIPTTLKKTTLGTKKIGDLVNLEFDLVGKYAAKVVGK